MNTDFNLSPNLRRENDLNVLKITNICGVRLCNNYLPFTQVLRSALRVWMHVCVRAFECVRSRKKNTADSHLAMDRRLHFFSYVAMKCGADLNATGGILSPATGLTAQQVVRSHTPTRERPLVSHFNSYRTGLRNIPKRSRGRGKATLT